MTWLQRLMLLVLAVSSSGCASLEVERTTETSGTFRSSAWSFTLLSFDIPAPALSTALGNAADSGRPDLVIEEETVAPYLWFCDWLLEIVGVRYAVVTGTWGKPVGGDVSPPGE